MSRTEVSRTEAPGCGPVLGVIGWSGSGKTTLLEDLVGRLAAAGLRVNVVKHSHHDIVLEPSHKDSARMRAAGAAEVMIASPYRVAIMRELRGAPEPPLAELLARLAPADLSDPRLLDEGRVALDELTGLLGLGAGYDFQR